MNAQTIFFWLGIAFTIVVALVVTAGYLYVKFVQGSEEAKAGETKAVDDATKAWRGLAESQKAVIESQKETIQQHEVKDAKTAARVSDCEEKVNQLGQDLLRMTARNGNLERGMNELRYRAGLPPLDFDQPFDPRS